MQPPGVRRNLSLTARRVRQLPRQEQLMLLVHGALLALLAAQIPAGMLGRSAMLAATGSLAMAASVLIGRAAARALVPDVIRAPSPTGLSIAILAAVLCNLASRHASLGLADLSFVVSLTRLAAAGLIGARLHLLLHPAGRD